MPKEESTEIEKREFGINGEGPLKDLMEMKCGKPARLKMGIDRHWYNC